MGREQRAKKKKVAVKNKTEATKQEVNAEFAKINRAIAEIQIDADSPAKLSPEDRAELKRIEAMEMEPMTEKEANCILQHEGLTTWATSADFISGPRDWMGDQVSLAAIRVMGIVRWAREDEIRRLLKRNKSAGVLFLRSRLNELRKNR